MKKVFIAILFVFTIFSFEKSYAIDPECLEMVMPDNWDTSENIDSIKVDTCTSSPTYNQWYVKKGIIIYCINYPFNEKPIPINEIRHWTDIDTNFPLLRSKLQYISNKYGDFSITRENPSNNLHNILKDFVLEFNDYICLDSLRNDLVDTSANIRSFDLRHEPQGLGVNENNDNIAINIDGNILSLNCVRGLNAEIRLFDIYGNILKPDFEIFDNAVRINIENLSVGVYFLIMDNSKPIKFIKY